MLTEMVKSFLTNYNTIEPDTKASSQIEPENILQDLSNQDIYATGAFFDDNNLGIFGSSDKADILERQKNKIMTYRNLAKTPDVNDALEEIINEITFSFSDKEPIILNVDEENEKITEAIQKAFTKILKLLNIKKNLYNIVRTSYIDGVLKLHCSYDKSTKNGIQSLKMIEPVYLYYDLKKQVFKYYDIQNKDFYQHSNVIKGQQYSPEEIVSVDFGLYEDGINLSYLEFAIKPANQLRTLEDLLIPMRFSRSISRRVFNVDIGDLPNKKGEEAMREMQRKFKYKKFYNTNSGEVTNQQHITSMVEDYWFANRSGGKGTTVDVLDETGNLGELNDILYFNRKLYKSLFIPSNRISIDSDADRTYDYTSTQTSKEDIKFFMFISRVRQVYISLFKNLLKREIISTGIMSESEYLEFEDKININFSSENMFIEKMNIDNFISKLEVIQTATEFQGKYFPVEKLLKDIFKWSDKEIENNLNDIQKEEKNPLYAKFYVKEEF